MLSFYTRKLLQSFTVQFVADGFVKIYAGMDEGRAHRTSVRDGWLGERSSSFTREKYQLNTRANDSPCSELVVGIGTQHKWRQEQNSVNLEVKADKEEFGTRFSRPQSQVSHTGVTSLQYYPNFMHSDVLCFLEPAVDQSSRLHYQHQPLEDKRAIYPPNFDVPSPVQPTLAGDTMVNDGHVIHMDDVLNVTKQEVLEFHPPSYTHKVT